MPTVFNYLRDSLNRCLETQPSNGSSPIQLATLRETSELAAALASGVAHRPLAARLFGELQHSNLPPLHDLWDQFCVDFLNGDLVSPPTPEIVNLKPSRSHEILAELYERVNALVLSFNFDGLTYRALKNRFSAAGDRVFILDDTAKIREFYGKDPWSKRSWPVWKVRGDVFFATCRESGCPSKGQAAPIYAITRDSGSKHHSALHQGTTLLACPECGKQRSLRISFPGLEEKERETAAIAKELWRYIVPTLSAVFIIGLSGVWDESIVKTLLTIADKISIPVFDIKPSQTNDPDNAYIEQMWIRSNPHVSFQRINADSDTFLNTLLHISATECTVNANSSPHATPLTNSLQPQPLPEDRIWDINGDFQVTVSIRENGLRKAHQQFKVSRLSAELPHYVAKHPDVEALSAYSQLGLKNYWWGRDHFRNHNRYLHSLGTTRVASCWHKALHDSLLATHRPHRSRDDLARENNLLMIATLLHDYGHLPFSHLFEEVFEELHWSTSAAQRRYDHLDIGTEKVSKFLNTAQIRGQDEAHYHVLALLQELGYVPSDVVKLIRGCSGIPYLDAIVNSPIDADKIDYIFRDSSELNLGVRLLPKNAWLVEFLMDQDVSPEGLIRLNGSSAIRMLELLETRKALYRDFYLAPWIRAMEAIAANIIIKFVLLSTSISMKSQLDAGTLRDPSPDWGTVKITLATERLTQEYNQVRKEDQDERLEQPLLMRMINMLQSDEVGAGIDQSYRKEFLDQIKLLLSEFDASETKTGSGVREHGEVLRSVYQRIHLAGPFEVESSQQAALREVVRYVQLLYPDKVIFAIASMPNFLSSANTRKYGAGRPVGENVLVPEGSPSTWTMKSDARVPMHDGQFDEFQDKHVEVILLDPWEGSRLSGKYVLDVFKRKCVEKGIRLKD